jgi:DNA-binding transcriptional ArsR family regulator
MDQERAIETFAALAQESRLAIFRLLVREEPLGLPVGEISRRLDIVPSTLSGHLGVLKRARLLKSTRRQREIHYATNIEAMSDLVRFVLEDCCNGRIENCGEIVSLITSTRQPPYK